MRLLLALLLLFSGSSWATFPADGTTLGYKITSGYMMIPGVYSSYQTLCQTWANQTGWPLSVASPTGCSIKNGLNAVVLERDTLWICPANASRTGNECNCNTGYFETNNTCQAEPPPPTCPAGTAGADFRFTLAPGQSIPEYAQEEDGRCVLQYKDTICTVGADGTKYCATSSKYTGDYCPATGCTGNGTGGTQPAKTPTKDTQAETNGPCQAGYYYGTINGATVCVPGQGGESKTTTSTTTTTPTGTSEKTGTTVTTTGTSANGTKTTQTTQTTLEQQWSASRQVTFQSESSVPTGAIAPATTGQSRTSTVTNPDGSKTEYTLTKQADGSVTGTAKDGTTVQKTDTTTCTGSSCTTNSTTTTNGTQTGSTSGTTTKDGLCKESPDNAQCGDGDGMFAGTCTAGFTCEGDAVQCAMAKKQHETSCALLENKSAESQLYDAEKGKTGDVTGSNPNNSTQAIGSGMFDYSSATGGGACIPDKSVTVMGQTLSLPFSNVCTWLDALGNILVSVSSLIALRIVMRG